MSKNIFPIIVIVTGILGSPGHADSDCIMVTIKNVGYYDLGYRYTPCRGSGRVEGTPLHANTSASVKVQSGEVFVAGPWDIFKKRIDTFPFDKELRVAETGPSMHIMCRGSVVRPMCE